MSDKRAAGRTPQGSSGTSDVVAAFLKAAHSLEVGDLESAEREAHAVLSRDKAWAEAHQLLGEIARRRGQQAEAERHFRRAIQVDSRVPYFHHALGNALQDAGRIPDAIDAYRRALRLAPEGAEAWNDLGTAYFAAGERERAAECYRKAVRHAPGHVVALANLGSALRALGDIRGAIGAYRRELWQRLTAALPTKRAPPVTLAEEAQQWWRRGTARIADRIADQALAEDPASALALEVKAQIAERAGDVSKAIDLLEKAVRASPDDARAWMLLATLQRSNGDHARSTEAFRKTALLQPKNLAAQRALARSLARAGERKEAVQVLERLAKADKDGETWALLGRVLLDGNDRAAAEVALSRALSMRPLSADALAQLSRLRLAQFDSTEALSLSERAIEIDPVCAAAHYWRGRALAFLGKWKEASESFREVTLLDSSDTGSVVWLALALRGAGNIAESLAVLREALTRRPDNFDLRSELVVATFENGDVVRAREMLDKLLADNPNHVRAIAAMAGLLNAEGRLDEAGAYAHRALALDAGDATAHQNLGITLLKLGQYAEGWDHYEWRTQVEELISVYRRFPYAEWQGDSLAGRAILIYAEQGLGDEIMFASCIADVARHATRVILECEPRLGEIFRRSFPGCAVFARERTQTNAWVRSLEPQPDVQAPAGSLPRHFRRRKEDFPVHDGYLKADPAKVQRWRARLDALGEGRKIGLSWRGGLIKTGRARRSLELEELAPVLKPAGLRLISLQYGSVTDELTKVERAQGLRVLHFQETIDDYDECAALICALDGVVSVCTSIVHLAGALGRPVLVMAPYSPEWRYGMSGAQMPWYPSVNVLRQPRPGDWPAVLGQVRDAFNAGFGRADWPTRKDASR